MMSTTTTCVFNLGGVTVRDNPFCWDAVEMSRDAVPWILAIPDGGLQPPSWLLIVDAARLIGLSIRASSAVPSFWKI